MAKSAPLDVRKQIDLPLVVKRGRGRPKKADALTNAERQRRWRQKTVTVKASVLEAALSGASQLEAVDFQLDGMDRLHAENDRLRTLVAELSSGLTLACMEVDAMFSERVKGRLEARTMQLAVRLKALSDDAINGYVTKKVIMR